MFERDLTLNKDQTNQMVGGNPLQIRNVDLSSNFILDQFDIHLSAKLRNVGIVLDENLNLKYQNAAVGKKAIGGLINLGKYRILSKDSKN